ncbi:protein of unknown function [Methanoculleus bourgensis]|uniref:Uncharacterized protein n=1 Tax=Methanoculleus bourgensis TaxID=83986 RepID=A0A0X3BMF4_9EURY|nr:protein of unknown function [Methanoculleus bourgensis]
MPAPRGMIRRTGRLNYRAFARISDLQVPGKIFAASQPSRETVSLSHTKAHAKPRRTRRGSCISIHPVSRALSCGFWVRQCTGVFPG